MGFKKKFEKSLLSLYGKGIDSDVWFTAAH